MDRAAAADRATDERAGGASGGPAGGAKGGPAGPGGGDYHPGGRPFTGRRMLAVVLGFFGVVLAVNLTMAWFAVSSFRGVIVDSGFVASQDFNRDRARAAEQAALGWRVETSAPGGRPRIALIGPDGAALAGVPVTATALRPLDQRLDVPLTLTQTAPGVWTAAETLAPGQWRLAVAAGTAAGGPPWSGVAPLIVAAD